MEEQESKKEEIESIKEIEIVETLEQKFIRELKEFEINGFVFVDRAQVFHMGNPSERLLEIGIPNLPVLLTQAVINKAIGNVKNKQDAGHELNCGHLTTLPFSIQNPIIAIESVTQPDSIVLFTEIKDSKRETAIVVIRHGTQVGRVKSNVVVSIHTRSNNQLVDLLTIASSKGEILSVDKDKIKNWLKQVGKLQLLSKL